MSIIGRGKSGYNPGTCKKNSKKGKKVSQINVGNYIPSKYNQTIRSIIGKHRTLVKIVEILACIESTPGYVLKLHKKNPKTFFV